MKTITIANQKGGVGKSTISINLSNGLRRRGYKVGLKDIDYQGTVISCAYDEFISIYNRDQEPSPDLDFLVIDTPPYKADIYTEIFINSDIIVIPSKPYVADYDAMSKFIEIYNRAQFKNPHLKGYFLFNDFKKDTNLHKQMQEEFKSFGLPILNSYIENRIAYASSLTFDEGIYSETDKKAIKEIDTVTDEILNILGHGKKSRSIKNKKK